MQPAARLSAAIEILDIYLSGQPVEKVLTTWARRSRFAGSKDRAAIRDIVFDCLRRRKSFAAIAGAETGRGLVFAHTLTNQSQDAAKDLFSGARHAPSELTEAELRPPALQKTLAWEAQHDLPLWLKDELDASLGDQLATVSSELKKRAPVFLRVNLARVSREEAQQALATEEISAEPHPYVHTALQITHNHRKIQSSDTFKNGLVELQDAHSQQICLDLPRASRMLDYCAGGGGKVLAYGALHNAELFAHDANAARLNDIPDRAKRGGLTVQLLGDAECQKQAPFDLVICDVPCSGSGSWRRGPEGKWSTTSDRLIALHMTQAEILDKASQYVSNDGTLAYITCSFLNSENTDQIQRFTCRNSEFSQVYSKAYLPDAAGDGFFVSHLTRNKGEL